MKNLIERLLIKILKYLNTNLLPHAHVQIGVGHNTYVSGEGYIIDTIILEALKRQPKIILDVGANIGDYAIQLVKKFRASQIYCFEPVPDNFKTLVNNTAGLNIININTAVGNKPGKVKLFIGANDINGAMATLYGQTLTNVFHNAGIIDQEIDSEVITLDNFCNEYNIAEIDFLKIDVEGHELQVLKGTSSFINKHRINIIQFEFNEFNIFSKSFMWDFYDILNQYDFYRIMPSNKLLPMGNYTSALEIFRYQNILAIHHSLAYQHG